MIRHRLWIDGKWIESAQSTDLTSPATGTVVAKVDQASREQMEIALEASTTAFSVFKNISRFTRSRLLAVMAREIEAHRAEFIECLITEAGKPHALADVEVTRATITFTLAAEEAKRLGGEVVPVDLDAGGRAYGPAVSYWVPRGPVLAITPFNFPLNLAAHKLAPALAVGATVIVKPPPQAPGCAALLAAIFEKAAKEVSDVRESVPLSAFQVVNGANEIIAEAVADPRMTTLSFTGSDKVGWKLQEKAVRKKVVLELGGNAGVIVHEDADLNRAASRCAFGGFVYAGQTCISVQRIFVHEKVHDRFLKLLLEETAKVKSGDPRDKEVLVGPLIDEPAALRVMAWIDEAVKEGAKVLAGGTCKGNFMAPTVLSGVKTHHKLHCEEVFGPVVIVDKFNDFDRALEMINRSRFGLQAGLFTDSSALIQRALKMLEVGGIIVNEVPTYRADNMPYGGVKESGLGREGVRYAMEDYCERRVLVTWQG
jgi:acyl-CoA reductase-like NAD-dependent aldehyde dehydrogenase